MALMGTTTQQHGYACKCLNIRVKPQQPPDPPPSVEKDYDAVYVGDEGLSVTHIPLTLRSRTRPVKMQDGQGVRYTSLTCLLCQTLVYQVYQVVDTEIEDREGPVIPADDRAEQDMLKSSSGWVEVYKGCLAGEAIIQAERSETYSKLFGVVLPSGVASPPTQPQETTSVPQSSGPHLPPLPPVFQPPPFSPSHPVFSCLSSIANTQSEHIRNAAAEAIAHLVSQKVQEILSAEADLRWQVEHVWSTYMEGLEKIEGDFDEARRPSLARCRPSSGRRAISAGEHGSVTASVRINDFVPPPSPPVRRTSPAATFSKVASALSASLVTSSFHHPRARDPSPARSGSPRTASSLTMPVGDGHDGAASIREAYRRNMDEGKDVATSFRYVMDLGAQMEDMRGRHGQEDTENADAAKVVAETSAAAAARSVGRSKSPKGRSALKKVKSDERKEPVKSEQEGEKPEEPLSPGEKGKRKVTFSVKPEVAIIDGEVQREPQQTAVHEEELFDMESEDDAERPEVAREPTTPSPISPTSPTTPDLPTARRRIHRLRKSNEGPISFASLRPSSLPAPSSMRPPERWTEPASVTASRSETTRECLLSPDAGGDRQQNGLDIPMTPEAEDEENVGLRETEILRLVNAGTPSHRSAWKKDSKAWQLFVNSSERRSREPGDTITEEEEGASSLDYASPDCDMTDDSGFEDEDSRQTKRQKRNELEMGGIAQSLPIPIGRPNFGTPAEQSKTLVPTHAGTVAGSMQRVSSSALRKAAYAERDRGRSIDPGALDSIVDEDEDEDHEDEVDPSVGSTGRQRALKILEARDRLPADGMWRSLAS